MGWNRLELKFRGKETLKNHYWRCFLVSLVFLVFSSFRVTKELRDLEIKLSFFHVSVDLAVLLVGVLVVAVLKVGFCRFYVENRDYPAPASKLFFGFQGGYYGNLVLTMFLTNLKIILWSFLFLVPGIVKMYEYRMVPYILAEQPDIRYEDAQRISREMMMGQKLEALLLDVSFLGWWLLAIVTGGLVGIFWTAPYRDAVNVELYVVLRNGWLRVNESSQANLGGDTFW